MQPLFKQLNLDQAAPLIYAIYKQAFTRDFDMQVPDIETVKNYLTKSRCYIGYDGSDPVCYFAYELQPGNQAELMTTGVLPQYQHQGMGNFMLQYFLEQVKGKKVKLITHPRNTTALILYLKLGFIIYGWKDNYYGDGQPRLLLSKKN